MRRIAIAASLVSLMASPAPAQPAGPAPDPRFDCLLEGISAEQRTQAGYGGGEQFTDVPSEDEQRSRAAVEMIAANARRCAAAARWTENQRELALQYVLMQLSREAMIRRYAAQNVDLTYIDAAVAAAPPEGPVPFEAMVARMRAQGVGDSRPDSASDIVYIYMMTVGLSAEIRANFDDPNFRPQ
jgi:hypothetical protein